MNFVLFIYFLLSAVAAHSSSAPAAAADPVTSAQEQADSYYQNGNCVKSMLLYRSLYHRSDTSRDLKDLIRFRASFCYLELNQTLAAKKGFEEFLKTFPNHDEARLKFAEALFRIQDYRAARENALMIKDPDRIADARLIAAHADMALGEYVLAVYHLNSKIVSEAWIPVFSYWKGAAAYKHGELKIAREYFQEARSNSPHELWVKEKAQEWLTQLDGDLQFIKARATIGYFYDGNVGQQSLLAVNSSGDPIVPTPNPASYTKDHGLATALGLTFLMHYSRPFRLYSSLDASSSFYKENRTYNQQTFSGSLTGQFHLSNSLDWNITARASQGRYQFLYYQNYLSLDNGLSWSPTDELRLDLSLGLSRQVKSRPATTTSISASGTYAVAPWLYFTGGLNSSKTIGEYASYSTTSSGYPVLATGSMFSSYFSRGITLGPNVLLPYEAWLKISVSRSWTNYEAEKLPVFQGNAFQARKDISTAYYVELSRHIVRNAWYVSASYTHTSSRSVGFQGLASSVISNYNYERPYAALSTTLYY